MPADPRAVRTIGELPFCERPVLELLGLDSDRDTIDVNYAGYGWAQVDHLWLADARGSQRVDDVLLLALHSSDGGELFADDVELEFELADAPPVCVLLSAFLRRWLPRLPSAPTIVLAMCNPYDAYLRSLAPADAVMHYGLGPVDAWLDVAVGGLDRVRLVTAQWRRSDSLPPRSPELPRTLS